MKPLAKSPFSQGLFHFSSKPFLRVVMQNIFFKRALAGFGLLLLLAGCASTPQTTFLLAQPPADLPAKVELTTVPFFPQEDYQCGPAALATALVHAGVKTTPNELTEQVYLPQRKGSLQVELLGATRRHGMVAYRLRPQLESVLRELSGGEPVVVLQNLRLKMAPQWHYAVVVGYDLPRNRLVLRSGTKERLELTFSQFERTWADGEHWAIVVLPPSQVPVTATEEAYLSAVAALERVAPGAALQGYQTALKRWPGSLAAYIGIGNAAYGLKDLSRAESAYRSAVAAHPEAGDAWNNLAQVLFERGNAKEAQAAAQRAVALGGPRRVQYEETLKEVSGRATSPL
jgi:hypothetical protein